jgi:hypothetical protein
MSGESSRSSSGTGKRQLAELGVRPRLSPPSAVQTSWAPNQKRGRHSYSQAGEEVFQL